MVKNSQPATRNPHLETAITMIKFITTLILLILLQFTFFYCPAAASSTFRMSGLRLEITSNYDDNILRYSDRDLERFENNTEYYPSKLTTVDDWENEFTAKAYFESRSVFSRPLKIKYFGKFAHYYRNSFRNYTNHTLLLSQYITRNLEIHFKYFYMPDYYLREYRDRDLNEYHSCSFDDNQARLGINYRFSKKTEMTVQTQFEQIYYNQYFTEYDSELMLYEGILEHKFSLDFRVNLKIGFCVSDNIGYEPSADSAESSLFEEDTEYGDCSYEEEIYQAEIRYRMKKLLGEDTWFTLQYKLRHRIYTSDNSLDIDPFHAGRLDNRHRAILEISRSLSPRLNTALKYTLEWRTTESDCQSVIKAKKFQQNVFSLSLTYKLF